SARGGVRLQERRSTRPRPHLDEKVLTAWNGLMIAAFARAARTLDVGELRVGADLKVGPYVNTVYLNAARRAALFIWKHLWNAETRTLLRRYRRGDAAVEGYAGDYGYLIFGLLGLF